MENISIQFVNGLMLRGVLGTKMLVLGDRTAGTVTFGFDNKDLSGVDTAFPGIRWNGLTLQYSNDGVLWKTFGDTSNLDSINTTLTTLNAAIADLEVVRDRLDALIGW